MKIPVLMFAFAAALSVAGCGHLQMDTGALSSDANREVRGSVELGDEVTLPPDAVVAVRVLDQVHSGYRDPNAVRGEHSANAGITLPPTVLGEQKIEHPGGNSVPFDLKFYCSDQQLAAGLVLEARVSAGGKVRYFSVDSTAVNSGNIGDPRRIYVNQVR